MFYSGSLQEGISQAVEQQKLVLCFVTDESQESQAWEEDFLQDERIREVMASHSVALKLMAGSEEAGYLAQIFPVPKVPTLIIMKHGELKEYITSGTKKEEFIRRVETTCLSRTAKPASSTKTAATTTPESSTSQSQGSSTSSITQAGRSESLSTVLAERAARLKAERDEAERRHREAKKLAKDKGKAEATRGEDTQSARSYVQTELLRKKREQGNEERQRILSRIQNDKEERKAKASERRQMNLELQRTGDVANSLVDAPRTNMPSTTQLGDITSVQVRLFDGSTIRSRFKTVSPMSDIRNWVDSERKDKATPYQFKQVLTPLPNRNIDETEEKHSVGDLGLSPSSTLVIIPVHNYTKAYSRESNNIFMVFLSFILGIFAWLGALFGIGGATNLANQPAAIGQANLSPQLGDDKLTEGSQGRQAPRRPGDQQLYNGNSLNFESRPDDYDNE